MTRKDFLAMLASYALTFACLPGLFLLAALIRGWTP